MYANLNGAVIVAAGSSRRMGGQDKLLAPLAGKPLLWHTLRAFEQCEEIGTVVLVLSPDNAAEVQGMLRAFKKVQHTCLGGARRQDSVRGGLMTLPPCDFVAVHDGARPLVTPELISRGLASARVTGAASAAVAVVDTLKAAGRDGIVTATVPRDGLWAVQTPQVFRYDLLLAAHEQAAGGPEATDDCALAEQAGHEVFLYQGSRQNLKVTTPEDLVVAEALLRHRRREAGRRVS